MSAKMTISQAAAEAKKFQPLIRALSQIEEVANAAVAADGVKREVEQATDAARKTLASVQAEVADAQKELAQSKAAAKDASTAAQSKATAIIDQAQAKAGEIAAQAASASAAADAEVQALKVTADDLHKLIAAKEASIADLDSKLSKLQAQAQKLLER